jgi:hypothetical protein
MEEEVITPEYFLSLPAELQQKIAIDLDVQSILNLCSTSEIVDAKLCKDETFWKQKHYRDFGDKRAAGAFSWFESYKINSLGILDFQITSRESGKWLEVKNLNRTIINIPLYYDLSEISEGKINARDLLDEYEFSLILFDNEEDQIQLAKIEGQEGYVIISNIFYIDLRRPEAIRLIEELNKYL